MPAIACIDRCPAAGAWRVVLRNNCPASWLGRSNSSKSNCTTGNSIRNRFSGSRMGRQCRRSSFSHRILVFSRDRGLYRPFYTARWPCALCWITTGIATSHLSATRSPSMPRERSASVAGRPYCTSWSSWMARMSGKNEFESTRSLTPSVLHFRWVPFGIARLILKPCRGRTLVK